MRTPHVTLHCCCCWCLCPRSRPTAGRCAVPELWLEVHLHLPGRLCRGHCGTSADIGGEQMRATAGRRYGLTQKPTGCINSGCINSVLCLCLPYILAVNWVAKRPGAASSPKRCYYISPRLLMLITQSSLSALAVCLKPCPVCRLPHCVAAGARDAAVPCCQADVQEGPLCSGHHGRGSNHPGSSSEALR